jgi:hypothetical protein
MRNEKILIDFLRKLAAIIGEEASQNPSFANKLEELIAPLPRKNYSPKMPSKKNNQILLPDIYTELNTRGETEFKLWLRNQPIKILREIIRKHDLDATRRTNKWKEPEKLSGFIYDQLKLRLSRGSSFLNRD